MYSTIGIDLGSDSTRIFAGRGVVLNEPSAITVEARTGEPIAFGIEAAAMTGRTSDRFLPIYPLERGAIADFDAAGHLIEHFMRKVCGNRMTKPRVMATMPIGLTTVQQRSVVDALQKAGARSVCLIESPLAAAVGLSIDFSAPRGTTIVDIGKGTTDVAVLSMGALTQYESIKVAGADFDDAIIKFIRKNHNIAIGLKTASEIKHRIGCVDRRAVEVAICAKGLNLFTGLPQIIEVDSTAILEALADPVESMVKAIRAVIEKTPPELVGDLSRDGIYLMGGGALVYGMESMLSRRLETKVTLVEDPLTCVIRGTGRALGDLHILRGGNYRFRTLKDLIVE